jgi:hypothetical protein
VRRKDRGKIPGRLGNPRGRAAAENRPSSFRGRLWTAALRLRGRFVVLRGEPSEMPTEVRPGLDVSQLRLLTDEDIGFSEGEVADGLINCLKQVAAFAEEKTDDNTPN